MNGTGLRFLVACSLNGTVVVEHSVGLIAKQVDIQVKVHVHVDVSIVHRGVRVHIHHEVVVVVIFVVSLFVKLPVLALLLVVVIVGILKLDRLSGVELEDSLQLLEDLRTELVLVDFLND